MTANVSSFHQNYAQERKCTDPVEKDIRKWVESVVEFKANLDKQGNEPPLEKHLKRIKKFKVKKKPSLVSVQVGGGRNVVSGQRKNLKPKKALKKPIQVNTENPRKKESSQVADVFDEIKASFRNIKLPQNWTSGLSSGKVVFNRIKVTTYNAQQKMTVERSLVITKDLNVHILINGSEITLNNWEIQKIETIDDIKRAIKDIDSLKVCDGPPDKHKNPQSPVLTDNKLKACQTCKSEIVNPQKLVGKKSRETKKSVGGKGIVKQKSFQK